MTTAPTPLPLYRRPSELGRRLVGAVVELGRLTDTPTPHIDTVYALVKLRARTMDEARGMVRMQPAA